MRHAFRWLAFTLSTAIVAIGGCAENPDVDARQLASAEPLADRTVYEPRAPANLELRTTEPVEQVDLESLLWPDDADFTDGVSSPLVLSELYETRDYEPLWIDLEADRPRLTEAGQHLADVLQHTPLEHGLDLRFHTPEVPIARAEAAHTELAYADSLVQYARVMGVGKRGALADEQTADDRIVETLRPLFEDVSQVDQIEEVVEPPHPQYDALLDVYASYLDAESSGGFEVMPPSAAHLDARSLERHAEPVASRLQAAGYWVDDGQDFGEDLTRSLRTFQRAHSLEETGWLNSETLQELNVSAAERRQRVERALRQWRQSPIGGEDHYVFVNIPDYHAEVWKDGVRQMRFKVIVGAGENVYNPGLGKAVYQAGTPRFSDEIAIIEFNPYWWIPNSIVHKEFAPIQRRDSSFYRRMGYEWGKTPSDGYRLRQKPGPDNALGLVKFLFPNKHDVYLHDTNKRDLFDEEPRNLSHGCVRIENPFDLARYLLIHDGKADSNNVQQVIDGYRAEDEPVAVELDNPLPIHIEYIPVRVDDEGFVHFLGDPYDLLAENG